jgi:hypothetical protein
MNKEPVGLKFTNNQSPPATTATNDDDDDFNFSSQNKYKKFTNFPKESNKPKQQKKIAECNCWVCKILDSSSSTSSSVTDKITATKRYEAYNIVSETGDSIFYDPLLFSIFDNENKLAGEIYIAEDGKIRDIVQQDELVKFYNGGVKFNKNEY